MAEQKDDPGQAAKSAQSKKSSQASGVTDAFAMSDRIGGNGPPANMRVAGRRQGEGWRSSSMKTTARTSVWWRR